MGVVHPIKKKKKKQDLRVFWKLVNLQERRRESLPNHHEDHIAGKANNSLQHYNLVNKFFPLPQALEIQQQKVAVDKECEKLEKISAWNLTKVRSEKEVSMKQGRRAQKFILPH